MLLSPTPSEIGSTTSAWTLVGFGGASTMQLLLGLGGRGPHGPPQDPWGNICESESWKCLKIYHWNPSKKKNPAVNSSPVLWSACANQPPNCRCSCSVDKQIFGVKKIGFMKVEKYFKPVVGVASSEVLL